MKGSLAKSRDVDEMSSTTASIKEARLAGGGGGSSERLHASRTSMYSGTSILEQGVGEQLLQAREILEAGLNNVSYARSAVALTDGKSIADIGWVRVSANY